MGPLEDEAEVLPDLPMPGRERVAVTAGAAIGRMAPGDTLIVERKGDGGWNVTLLTPDGEDRDDA